MARIVQSAILSLLAAVVFLYVLNLIVNGGPR
jgi:hypothetical protein